MDVREREESQSRPQKIKRPWDEDQVLPVTERAWYRTILPPINAEPYRRPSIARETESGINHDNPYNIETAERTSKRPRYEGHINASLPQENSNLNGKVFQPQRTGKARI